MQEHRVHRDDAGQRLDRYLRKLLPKATLGHIFKLLRTGKVLVDGKKALGKLRLSEGQLLGLFVNEDLLGGKRAVTRVGGELNIVHEDEHVLALDKPALLAVHAGTGHEHDNLMARVHARSGVSGARTFRPAPAHRIDLGTSGLVLFGMSAEGLRGLTKLFRERRVCKRYLALIAGVMHEDAGLLESRLLREEDAQVAVAKVHEVGGDDGQVARTRFRQLEVRGGVALLELELETGRMHQIRAQLGARGRAVLGDRRYGYGAVGSEVDGLLADGRFLLHARRLELEHPVFGGELELVAELPEDFRLSMELLGFSQCA